MIKSLFINIQYLTDDFLSGTYFAPIDLRWGINKNQSQEGRVISLCLDYIHDGAPYFICLLGKYFYMLFPGICDMLNYICA